MIRSVLAVATITAITIGVSAAQEDPIKTRKALITANGDQAKIGAAMVKGDKPFDLAAVHKIFATFEDAAAKMPALFPDSSKSEANSRKLTISAPHPRSGKRWPTSTLGSSSSARMRRRPPPR